MPIQRDESRLEDAEVANIDRWLKEHDQSRADMAAKIGVDPTYLNRVFGAEKPRAKVPKPRQNISLPQLRHWCAKAGIPLYVVFMPPEEAERRRPRPQSISDVRAAINQQMVDAQVWLRILRDAEGELQEAKPPATRAEWVRRVEEEAARYGVPDPKIQLAFLAEPPPADAPRLPKASPPNDSRRK